ncbi:MAG: hypothetical protein IPK83_07990 [Planctomycetes bacterium]|nr:hypothetical protein [Planctomycetota bacterium]
MMSRAIIRIPLKLLAFGIVTILTLFPDPIQLSRHLSHVTNLEKMVQPDAPELAAMEVELLARLDASAIVSSQPAIQNAPERSLTPVAKPGVRSPRETQREVERFVLEKVPYDWDWNIWGSADYMPTIAEMFEKAKSYADGKIREDCDGRAVMAASLMRRLGYDSHIVTDLRHVWVVTKEGEWMGPGRAKSVRSTSRGNKTDVWATIINIPVSLSYGIAVFPLWRECIIAATAYLLLLHRKMGWRSAVIGGILLIEGLLFMRLGYLAPQHVARDVSAWPSWIGILHLLLALGVLMRSSHMARRRVVSAQ